MYARFKKCTNILAYFPKTIYENASCDGVSELNVSEINNLSTWLSEAPKYTTFRVNTLVKSIDEVEQIIKDILDKEAAKHNVPPPEVFRHTVLSDCIIVSPWSECLLEPDLGNHEVIVDATCGAAVLRGADIYAPGVMALSHSVCEGNVINVYADTAGKCLRGLIVPYVNPGKLFLGCGLARMTRKQLFEGDTHPNGVAVEMIDRVSRVPRLCQPQLYRSKFGLLQNLPSMLCCYVLNPKPGLRVLDMCASPGNKTTHIATLMENKGKIIALDKTKNKVNTILAVCERLSLTCVEAFVCDSTEAVAHKTEAAKGPPFAPCSFNAILLDAPCSGLGQRPQLVNSITDNQIESYPSLQKKLFRSAVSLLEPGGTLVYSTCTLTLQENEDIVQWALEQFSELVLVPAEPILGKPGSSQHGLSEEHCLMVQRFGPPSGNTPETDTIGFFIAKFLKLS